MTSLAQQKALLVQLGFESLCPAYFFGTNLPPRTYFTEQKTLRGKFSDGEGVTARLVDGTFWSRMSNLSCLERLRLIMSGFKNNTHHAARWLATHP